MLVLLLEGAGTVKAAGREWGTRRLLEKHSPGIAMLAASKRELGFSSARSLWSQARLSLSPAAAAEQEQQGKVGSEESACAQNLEQLSKDKAESEHECVLCAWGGGCGELHPAGSLVSP